MITKRCPSCDYFWQTDPIGFTKKWRAVFKDLPLRPICVECGYKQPLECNNPYKHHRWYCYGIHC